MATNGRRLHFDVHNENYTIENKCTTFESLVGPDNVFNFNTIWT